jgi:hypothetical protein
MPDMDCSSSGEYSDDSEQESEEIRPAKRARKRNSAQDLWKSPWGVMIRSDEINNPLVTIQRFQRALCSTVY